MSIPPPMSPLKQRKEGVMPHKRHNGQMAMLRREDARQAELQSLRAQRPTKPPKGFPPTDDYEGQPVVHHSDGMSDAGIDALMQAAMLTFWAIALLAVLILLLVAIL